MLEPKPCFLAWKVVEKLHILSGLTRTHSCLWKVTKSSCLEGRQWTKSSCPEGRQMRTGFEFDRFVVAALQSTMVDQRLQVHS
jgi:hypothetical protein